MQKSSAVRQSISVLATLLALLCVPAGSRAALVAAWGDNTFGETRLPVGVNNIKAIAGGDYHGLALRSDGSVVAWGLNNQGQINVPSGLTNVKAIAAGGNHCLALRVDGSVVAWGSADAGLSNVPGNLSRATAIACGALHNLALNAAGTVIAWGDNANGATQVPAGLSDVTALAAGADHSLALKADGSVVAWGSNAYGQTNVPSDLSNVVAIAAHDDFNLALKADGTVVAWGYDYAGQTNVPVGLSNVIAVAAGYFHALALRTDGTIVTWGDNTYGQSGPPAGLAIVTAIAAGRYFSLALVADGPVQMLQNPESQGVPYTSNVTCSALASGREPLGYQWCFNGSPISPNARVSSTTNATLIISNAQFADIGSYSVVVSNPFGSVLSSSASLTVISPPFITRQPTDLTVRAGSEVAIPALASGTPPLGYQWNFNGNDIPGATNATLSLPEVQAADSGGYAMKVTNAYGSAQTIPASLVVTDSAPYLLQQPYVRLPDQSTTTNPVAQMGGSVTINVSARGSTPLGYQWRLNGADLPDATNSTLVFSNLRYEQTGYYNVEISNAFGTTNSAKIFLNVVQIYVSGESATVAPGVNTPTNVPAGLTNVIAVAAGSYHLLALRADGRVATWANFEVPASLTNVPASVTNVVAIAAAGNNSMALRANGTVIVWGDNTYGQITPPGEVSNIMAIASGGSHSLALRTNGTIIGWGNKSYGQPTPPLGLSNVIAIAAGGAHSLALKADGTVVGWGYNAYGQTNVPAGLSNVLAIDAAGAISLALQADGTAVAWGDLYGRVPANVTNLVATGVGYLRSSGLTADGKIVAWVSNETPPAPALSNVIAITSGERGTFSAAVIGDGTPFFTVQPASQATTRSHAVQLHARAAGIQPMSFQWQHDGADLPGATNPSLTLTNLQGQDTGSYRVIASNALGATWSRTARLTIPYNPNLAAALNPNNWQWANEGTTNWFAQIRETHDGDVAAQSGAIGNNQQSILETGVGGPGRLTFWWKVSSEEGFDFLRFYLDNLNLPLTSISGETGWQQLTIVLAAGGHRLRWTYAKDLSVSAGRDAGWLDEVVFTPDPPVITLQPTPPSTIAAMGTNFTLRVTATGLEPLGYQWLKNSAALAGATQSSLTLTPLTRRDSGTYAVRVSNAGGETLSRNATLVVRVPQRLQTPVPLADGRLLVTSGDADGGALLPEDLPALEAQASTNLVDWVTLPGVPVLTHGSLVLRDPDGTNFPVRFYRMVEH